MKAQIFINSLYRQRYEAGEDHNAKAQERTYLFDKRRRKGEYRSAGEQGVVKYAQKRRKGGVYRRGRDLRRRLHKADSVIGGHGKGGEEGAQLRYYHGKDGGGEQEGIKERSERAHDQVYGYGCERHRAEVEEHERQQP